MADKTYNRLRRLCEDNTHAYERASESLAAGELKPVIVHIQRRINHYARLANVQTHDRNGDLLSAETIAAGVLAGQKTVRELTDLLGILEGD